MNTANERNRNWTTNWGTSLLAAMALLVLNLAWADVAKAGVRIRARVNTPQVSVDFHKGPHYHDNGRYYESGCVIDVRITKYDRKVAKRLARATGYRKGRLLNMRSQGYTWREIGWELGIGHRTMRYAMHGGKKWKPRDRWNRGHYVDTPNYYPYWSPRRPVCRTTVRG